jgi:hypothetical protein
MDTNGDNSTQALQFWIDFSSKLASAGAALNPFDPPTDNARKMRTALFTAMSESADQFMRSPQFLEFVKQSSDVQTDFRAKLNEFLTAARHDSQGVAREDIDSVISNMHHMGVRILDRMEELGTRLDAIGARLDALEGKGEGSGEINGKSRRQSPQPDAVDAPAAQPEAAPAPATEASADKTPRDENEPATEKSPQRPQQQSRKGRQDRNR